MKRTLNLVLCIIMICTLVGCSSSKSEAEECFNKMKEEMKKKDSFLVSVYTINMYRLEKLSNDYIFASFNEFYDKNKKEGYQTPSSILGNEVFLKNNKCYEKSGEGIKEVEDSGILMLNYEFLNIKLRDVKNLKLVTVHKKKNLRIKLHLSREEVKSAEVEITLNKDYTINESVANYKIQMEEGVLELNSQVKFLNYGHQDIQFPEGIDGI